MRHSTLVFALILSALLSRVSRAADYDVPAVFPTLQAAVAAAEGSFDLDNNINITDPVIFTNAQVILDSDFRCTRRLAIRPDPDAGFERATIASQNGFQPIFVLTGASCVNFQDLDIVRYTTNANHLIVVTYEGGQNNDNVFERCRIGSIWTTPGSPGWDYMNVQACFNMVVRNCIFFSYFPGDFYRGIHVFNFSDPGQSILLYNNVVADHRLSGIVMHDITTGLVLLRNNVVANHPDAPAGSEPFAYRSGVIAPTRIVTSHNVAFASPANVEDFFGGGIDIAMGTDGSFLRFDRADVDLAFVDRTWNILPAWDPNPDFWRLEVAGPLHDDDTDWGQNVSNGFPDAGDIAVHDDIEKDFRPGGVILHTDRGADQIEAGLSAAVGDPLSPGGRRALQAAPLRNPGRSARVQFQTIGSGRLTGDLFDPMGRQIHRVVLQAGGGERGILEWPVSARGVLVYCLRLESPDRPTEEISGKLIVMP